jgi:uncharacterized protein (DUF305 family)
MRGVKAMRNEGSDLESTDLSAVITCRNFVKSTTRIEHHRKSLMMAVIATNNSGNLYISN